jgi:deazaflavin-dependent oxidoreductase (nitroreductase family)
MSQSIAIRVPALGNEILPIPAQAPGSGGQRELAERLVLRLIGTLHRLAYRATGGWLGRTVRGGPVLLLTTVGRRSGQPRTWPLCYVEEGDRLILVASACGAPRHPGWYLNLIARQCVTVQRGSEAQIMRARIAEGTERARLWKQVVGQYPNCVDYQQRTTRLIPVAVLEPVPAGIDSPGGGGISVVLKGETER